MLPIHPDPLARYDALGRKQLKRMGFTEYLRAMPWLLGYFTKDVPGEMFMLDGEDAVVSCPCGVEPAPRVPFNQVVRCEGERCRRWFFFDGRRVRVARETAVVD